MLLDNIALFLTIIEKGSLPAAGRETGLSPTTVSERLAALEAYYGVVLLNRTTRAISLTEEGRTLMEEARGLLDSVSELETRIRLGAQTLTGRIRVSAPSDLGRNALSRAITEFQHLHPTIEIELLLSDSYVDIVGQGIDLALRFGTIMDSTLRVRHLGQKRRLICASPAYLAQHPAPLTPVDLKHHNCLVMRFGKSLDNEWRFGSHKVPQIVTVSGNRIANDGELVRQWCLEGLGIALKSEVDVKEDLHAGRLIELLPEHAAPPSPLQLLFPPVRAQPRRVQAFAQHLVETFSESLSHPQ